MPPTPSPFAAVELAPRDPILGLNEQFNADPNPAKVNLGVGVYFDDQGKLPVLGCVAAAEHQLLKGKLELVSVHTNILFTDIALDVAEPLLAYLAEQGIQLTSSNYNKADQYFKRVRWVTHLDISASDIQRALLAVQKFSV